MRDFFKQTSGRELLGAMPEEEAGVPAGTGEWKWFVFFSGFPFLPFDGWVLPSHPDKRSDGFY